MATDREKRDVEALANDILVAIRTMLEATGRDYISMRELMTALGLVGCHILGMQADREKRLRETELWCDAVQKTVVQRSNKRLN